MNSFIEGTITIALAIVGLAMLSVLVSKNANTAGVIQAGSSGFGNVLGVAQSPVSGTSVPLDLSYPTSQGNAFGF